MDCECTKVEVITTHSEAIKNLEKRMDEINQSQREIFVKLNVLENGLTVNKSCIENINDFVKDYKEHVPEQKKSFQKMIYFFVGNVLLVITLLASYMAYQNNMIVKLQEENKKMILSIISVEKPKTTQ